jgi:hypothetical protein
MTTLAVLNDYPLIPAKRLKKRKKVRGVNESLYPVKTFLENGFVETYYNGQTEYQAIFRPTTYDLTKLSQEEFGEISANYWRFHTVFKTDLKEIFLNLPEKNTIQQTQIMRKLKTTTFPNQIVFLKRELDKLKWQEKNNLTRQSFMIIYGKTQGELEERIAELRQAGGRFLDFEQLLKPEVLELFEKINNTGRKTFDRKKQVKSKKVTSDIVQTAPHGGLIFDKTHKYFQSATDYRLTLTVSGLPAVLQDFWLTKIVGNSDVDIATFDSCEDTSVNYISQLETSVDNLNTAIVQAKEKGEITKLDKLEQEQLELRELAQKMYNSGETIKQFEINLYLTATTQEALEKKAKQVIDAPDYEAQSYIGMAISDYQSLFLSKRLWSSKFENKFREPLELPAESFGIGFSHNSVGLTDPQGLFYGTTTTGGCVYFDAFAKTGARLSYNMFISGMMGSGKSVFLKHLVLDDYVKGNYIYGFDKSGEFQDLVERLSGAYLYLDGSNGMINLFQVFPLISNNDNTINVEGSFKHHIDLTVARFNMLYEFKTDNFSSKLKPLLKDFYVALGLYGKDKDVTAYANHQYPTFITFKAYVSERLSNESDVVYQSAYREILDMINDVIESNPEKFIGQTTLDNFLDKQVIFFDISMINEASVDPVYDTLFNVVLGLFLARANQNGRREKSAYENSSKPFSDINRTRIVIDECHNVLNPNKYYATASLSTLSAEGRKFFESLTLATQNIEKMLPENGDRFSGNEGKAINNLRNIIGLCQYKIWFKQPPTAIRTLQKYYRDSFRPFDFDDMKQYELVRGRGSKMMLMGASPKPITMYHYVTTDELKLFSGGA